MKRDRKKSFLYNELFFQFILTYSIMASILLISIALIHGITGKEADATQVCQQAVAAFSPTTITFIGTFLIDKYFSKDISIIRQTILTILLVINSLCYIAFESVSLGANQCIPVIIAIANLVLVILASFIMFYRRSSRPNASYESIDLSDGSVCAVKRNADK